MPEKQTKAKGNLPRPPASHMRISWPKLLLLVAMSIFGLWASSMVLIIYNALRQPLPFCPKPTGVSIGVVLNCEAVLDSQYSQVFGIPLELFAVAYFILNLLLVYFIAFGNDRLYKTSLKVLFVWRFLGIAIVPYLVFVELFLIKAICIYCTIMHVAIIADFIIISYLLFYKHGSLKQISLA
ncbi:MAG TPA: vitamin K epoxide reductase family protein [Candidatus Bathyarchaeia archaeon]|nr:vitamin K epoxide reductase family protein [Candidatus Bathyarchaeia archaeon]